MACWCYGTVNFAVEHWFGCRATEPGFAGDIGAIEIWLIDWLMYAYPSSWDCSHVVIYWAKLMEMEAYTEYTKPRAHFVTQLHVAPVHCHLSSLNMPRKPSNPPVSENLEKLIELVSMWRDLHLLVVLMFISCWDHYNYQHQHCMSDSTLHYKIMVFPEHLVRIPYLREMLFCRANCIPLTISGRSGISAITVTPTKYWNRHWVLGQSHTGHKLEDLEVLSPRLPGWLNWLTHRPTDSLDTCKFYLTDSQSPTLGWKTSLTLQRHAISAYQDRPSAKN